MVNNTVFTHGNSKLPKSTMIFNMRPAQGCPSASLGLCDVPSGKCYALRLEKRFPLVRRKLSAQEDFWHSCRTSFTGITNFVSRFISEKSKRTTALRFNVHGDLFDRRDLDLIRGVAISLETIGVVVYVYTARVDLLKDYPWALKIPNLRVMISSTYEGPAHWKGGIKHTKSLACHELGQEEGTHANLFMFIPKQDKGHFINHRLSWIKTSGTRVAVCPGDCKTCSACLTLKDTIIAVNEH